MKQGVPRDPMVTTVFNLALVFMEHVTQQTARAPVIRVTMVTSVIGLVRLVTMDPSAVENVHVGMGPSVTTRLGSVNA